MPPVSWLTITDPAAARVALAELADRLTRVYLYYPGSLDSLGECWPWHPAAVEELLALRGSWLAAYASPDATPPARWTGTTGTHPACTAAAAPPSETAP